MRRHIWLLGQVIYTVELHVGSAELSFVINIFSQFFFFGFLFSQILSTGSTFSLKQSTAKMPHPKFYYRITSASFISGNEAAIEGQICNIVAVNVNPITSENKLRLDSLQTAWQANLLDNPSPKTFHGLLLLIKLCLCKSYNMIISLEYTNRNRNKFRNGCLAWNN